MKTKREILKEKCAKCGRGGPVAKPVSSNVSPFNQTANPVRQPQPVNMVGTPKTTTTTRPKIVNSNPNITKNPAATQGIVNTSVTKRDPTGRSPSPSPVKPITTSPRITQIARPPTLDGNNKSVENYYKNREYRHIGNYTK